MAIYPPRTQQEAEFQRQNYGGGGGKRLQPAPPPVNYQQPSPFGRKGGARAQQGNPADMAATLGGRASQMQQAIPQGAADPAQAREMMTGMRGAYRGAMDGFGGGGGTIGGGMQMPQQMPFGGGFMSPFMQNRSRFGFKGGASPQPGMTPYRGVQGQLAKTQNRYADALQNLGRIGGGRMGR